MGSKLNLMLICFLAMPSKLQSSSPNLKCESKDSGVCSDITRLNLMILIENTFRIHNVDYATEDDDYVSIYKTYLKSIMNTFKHQYEQRNVQLEIIVVSNKEAITPVVTIGDHEPFDQVINKIGEIEFGTVNEDEGVCKFRSAFNSMLYRFNDTLKSSPIYKRYTQSIVLVFTRGLPEKCADLIPVQRWLLDDEDVFFAICIPVLAENDKAEKSRRAKAALSKLLTYVQLGDSKKRDKTVHREAELLNIQVFGKSEEEVAKIAEDHSRCICGQITLCQYLLSGSCFWKDVSTNTYKAEKCDNDKRMKVTKGDRDCPPTIVKCTQEDCDRDCELKGWTDFDKCRCPPPAVNNVQLRRRLNASASRSEYTMKSCKDIDSQRCPENYCAEVAAKRLAAEAKKAEEYVKGRNLTILIVVLVVLAAIAAAVFIVLLLIKRRRRRRKRKAAKQSSMKVAASAPKGKSVKKSTTQVSGSRI